MTTTNIEHLRKRIEAVIQEHLAASRRAAGDAVARAFGATGGRARRTPPAPGSEAGSRRRAPPEIAALGEQFYRAVCEKPGETMAVLAAQVGRLPRELNRPMVHLKRAGRVRSVGQRHLTRYFPMVERAAKSA